MPANDGGGGLQLYWDTAVAALKLWLAGLQSALRLHRVVVYFVEDPKILAKTGQCFLLNGAVFGGSVALLVLALRPAAQALLGSAGNAPQQRLDAGSLLLGSYNLLWLLPAYAISFLVNCIWYSELSELVVAAAQHRLLLRRAQREGRPAPAGAGPPMRVQRAAGVAALSQEAYRALLFLVLFLQAWVAGALPYIGPVAGFLLLSWLNALYCFDYKWGAHGVPLATRLAEVERGWAFFAGFGSMAALPAALAPFYVGAAATGVAFPLFIMLAADAHPARAYREVVGGCPRRLALGRPPLFGPALWATNRLLARGAALLRQRRQRPPDGWQQAGRVPVME